jgi:hypothetical protein
MKPFPVTVGVLMIAATLVPVPARAQQSDDLFHFHPGFTAKEFRLLAADVGSILRFRQLGDTMPAARGTIDVSVEFAGSPSDRSSQYVGESFSFPRVVARFGVSERLDVGAWGGYNAGERYGLAGIDTKILLVREGRSPVSVAIRPSATSLVGPADIWVAAASVDVTISRTFGAFSPYAGVASSGSVAIERSSEVDFDPALADRSLSYAGLSYRWRALVASGEVEKGARVSYAFRVGTRF